MMRNISTKSTRAVLITAAERQTVCDFLNAHGFPVKGTKAEPLVRAICKYRGFEMPDSILGRARLVRGLSKEIAANIVRGRVLPRVPQAFKPWKVPQGLRLAIARAEEARQDPA